MHVGDTHIVRYLLQIDFVKGVSSFFFFVLIDILFDYKTTIKKKSLQELFMQTVLEEKSSEC